MNMIHSSSDMSRLKFKIYPLHLPRFTGFGEIPPGLAKFHRVRQKSTGFGQNSAGLGSPGAVIGGGWIISHQKQ